MLTVPLGQHVIKMLACVCICVCVCGNALKNKAKFVL